MQDQTLAKRIHNLQTDIQQIKGPQPIGSDSAVTYVNATSNEWDYIWNATLYAGSVWNRFTIQFLADNQEAPFGRLRVVADFDGVPYDPSTMSNNYLSGNFFQISDNIFGSPNLEDFHNPKLLRWSIEASAVAEGTIVRFKFFVDCTDTGTILPTTSQN